MSKDTLYLFTGWFPYGLNVENTFLTPELEYLSMSFKKIVIIPEVVSGNPIPLPLNVVVDNSCAYSKDSIISRLRFFARALGSAMFWKELKKHPELLHFPKSLYRLAFMTGRALQVRDWIISGIKTNTIGLNNSLLYTYWMTNAIVGIAWVKNKYPNLKIVSRTHRFDLYENEHTPPFIPFREESLRSLDRLFCISENGKNYISGKYPWFASSCAIARLGVKPPGFVSQPSRDGIIRIVSCSYLVPFKRVDLIYKSILSLSTRFPARVFEWYHLGGGPLLKSLKIQVSQSPKNLNCFMLGSIPAKDVIDFYHHNPLDVFINLSMSEGISVAMMEAMSCGLPVVATNVGGTSEIVSDENGILLVSNPPPEVAAQAIWSLVEDLSSYLKKRNKSLQNWKSKYDATVNYQDFAKTISEM